MMDLRPKQPVSARFFQMWLAEKREVNTFTDCGQLAPFCFLLRDGSSTTSSDASCNLVA